MQPTGHGSRERMSTDAHERQKTEPLLLHRRPARHHPPLLPDGAALLPAGAAGGGVRDPLLSALPEAPEGPAGAEDPGVVPLLSPAAAGPHRAALPGGRDGHPRGDRLLPLGADGLRRHRPEAAGLARPAARHAAGA